MRTAWQRSEFLFCLLVFVVLAAALYVSRGWNQRAGLFPWFVLVPTLALTAWQLVDDLRGKTKRPAMVVGDQGEASALETDMTSPEMLRRSLITVGWILGFFVLIWLLGFPVGGGLATIAYLAYRREHWRLSIIYGVVAYLVLDIVFRQIIVVPFETGFLFEALGVDPRLPSIR